MTSADSGAVLPAAARLPGFDPEQVAHDPQFATAAARGAAVAAEQLTAAALRQRFAAPPVWQPEMRSDGRLLHLDRPPRAAAVLVPLLVRSDGLAVLLTRRTAHLHDHAGQISFPGGRIEDSDADAVAAALRETHEEIGLAPAAVSIIGALPEYLTATSYRVTPVVGLIERPFRPVLDAFEVDTAFEVPLAFLMNPANHERRRVQMGTVQRTFYAMPWHDPQHGRFFIWGATAAMLRNLYQFLRA